MAMRRGTIPGLHYKDERSQSRNWKSRSEESAYRLACWSVSICPLGSDAGSHVVPSDIQECRGNQNPLQRAIKWKLRTVCGFVSQDIYSRRLGSELRRGIWVILLHGP